MKRSLPRPSPAMVVAMVALFVSLGGVSYGVATGSIDSREIKNNSVRGKDIRNGTIKSRDVGNGSLRASDFGGALPAGPKGDKGDRGAQGLRGPAGAAGSAQAFAYVIRHAAGGTQLSGRSKGFTSVRHVSGSDGVYFLDWAPGQAIR